MQNGPKTVRKRPKTVGNRLKNGPKMAGKGFENGLNRLPELIFPGANISETRLDGTTACVTLKLYLKVNDV